MNEQALKIEQDKRLKERMSKIKHPFIVMSGKGGVGKTTMAVNLSYALADSGLKTGILDVDVHGPNIAKMLGVGKEIMATDPSGQMSPVAVTPNLKAVSMALLGYEEDLPFIWRGPRKGGVIRQLLSDVDWGELDYLAIDSPPGTGDEPLSVCQAIPNLECAVIVTTPQEVAVMDARKSILFAKELKIPKIGVIENMSGFICPHCGKEASLFKRGGGEKAASELKVTFLGSIPFESKWVDCADEGTPFAKSPAGADRSIAFLNVLDNIKTMMRDK